MLGKLVPDKWGVLWEFRWCSFLKGILLEKERFHIDALGAPKEGQTEEPWDHGVDGTSFLNDVQ